MSAQFGCGIGDREGIENPVVQESAQPPGEWNVGRTTLRSVQTCQQAVAEYQRFVFRIQQFSGFAQGAVDGANSCDDLRIIEGRPHRRRRRRRLRQPFGLEIQHSFAKPPPFGH